MVASQAVAERDDENDDERTEATATVHRAAVGRVRLKLLILSGPEAGHSHPLERGEYILGKGTSCTIVLKDRTVSRQHLKLEVGSEGVRATDLHPTTARSARACASRSMLLRPGSTITLGTTELKLVPEDTRERSLTLSSRDRFGALVGTSRKMREVFTLLERMAPGRLGRAHPGRDGHGQGAVRRGPPPGEPAREGPLRHRGPGGHRAPRSSSRSCSAT